MNPQENQKNQEITPDEAAASLAFSSKIMKRILGLPDTEAQTGEQTVETTAGNTEVEEEESPEKAEDTVETEDNSGELDELETRHAREISDLKAMIAGDKIESKYQQKIADMEARHVEEIKKLKDKVKSIINGNAGAKS